MSKYNSNAGFKNYDIPSEEENEEVVDSPLSKYKTGLIFGGIAVGVIVIIIVIMMIVIQNDNTGSDIAETSSEEEIASLDYNELFDVDPTDEDITISDPYAGIHNKKQQTTTQPPTITPAHPNQDKNNNNNNNNTNNGNNNNSNNSGGTSSGNSGGNSGGGNNSGGSSNNNSSSNNSGNSGGSGNSGNSGSSGNKSSGSSGNSGGSGNKSSGSSGNSTPQKTTPTPAPKPQNIAVTGVSISPRSVTIKKGSSVSLSASVSPSNATNKSITWTSSNTSVATVSGGRVTGVSAGRVNILAISNNGYKAYCEVTVTDAQSEANNVSISPISKTIKKNSALTIKLNGASKCTWSFSNPFVVNTISSTNTSITIKGAKAGMTNVIATLSNGKTYKSKITVQ